MNEIYIVILEDRHRDVEVFAWHTLASAMTQARNIIARYDYTPEDIHEVDEKFAILCVPLSPEGDYVTVKKIELGE